MSFEDRLADLERRVADLEETRQRRIRRTPISHYSPADIAKPLWAKLITDGMTPDEVKAEFTKFYNHAIASGRICAGLEGWQAAFRNWMGKVAR